MKSKIRHTGYSLLGISIALALLLGYPEVNRSRAKARAVVPKAHLRAGTTETVEEKVTLYPANLNTRGRLKYWSENHSYCGPPDYLPKKLVYPADIPGTIVAGFKNYYDKGAPVFGCPEGSNAAFRGAVWFDLSDIMKKAPPLHIAIQSATLNFKLTGGCPHELLYGTADWMKGYDENTLVPGDHVATLGSCIPGMDSCHIDVSVETVVNNWLKGAEHGGYANYGFVFKGMQDSDLHYENSDGCYSRYGDFSLILDYTYDKTTAAKLPDSYPLVCRGTEALKIMDFDGPVPFRWVGFNFIPGTGPAKNGLKAGQCSWVDREMRPGEPARLAQPIEKTLVWNKELDSSDSYWTFNVYNAGDQLQATGAERSGKPDIDYTKLGDSIPGGDKFAVARTNVALAANGGVASASSFTPDTEIPGYEFRPSSANDGNISGSTFPHNGFWRDGTDNVWPDWLQIDFAVSKISEIDIYSVQDTIDTTGPTDKGVEGLFSTINGIVDFEVLYWDGSSWQPIPGTMVKGNTRVLNKFTLKPAITTTAIRVNITAAMNKRSRIVELEAWK